MNPVNADMTDTREKGPNENDDLKKTDRSIQVKDRRSGTYVIEEGGCEFSFQQPVFTATQGSKSSDAPENHKMERNDVPQETPGEKVMPLKSPRDSDSMYIRMEGPSEVDLDRQRKREDKFDDTRRGCIQEMVYSMVGGICLFPYKYSSGSTPRASGLDSKNGALSNSKDLSFSYVTLFSSFVAKGRNASESGILPDNDVSTISQITTDVMPQPSGETFVHV